MLDVDRKEAVKKYEEIMSEKEEKDAKAARMNRDALLVQIEKFIMVHNTCTLATGCGQISVMQITGIAELVEWWTGEYMDLLAFKKIPAENLKKLPITMYLIKVTPTRIDFLRSEFRKLGFDSRQHLCLSNDYAE